MASKLRDAGVEVQIPIYNQRVGQPQHKHFAGTVDIPVIYGRYLQTWNFSLVFAEIAKLVWNH